MSTSYYSKYVKCPFYRNDEKKTILCEGAANKAFIKQSFSTRSEKIAWQNKYCNETKGYEKCPFYLAAVKKYEVKE